MPRHWRTARLALGAKRSIPSLPTARMLLPIPQHLQRNRRVEDVVPRPSLALRRGRVDGAEGLRIRDADLLGPDAHIVAVLLVQGLDIPVDLASRCREIGHVEGREPGWKRTGEVAQTVEKGPVHQDTREQARECGDGPDGDVLGGPNQGLGKGFMGEEASDE